MRPMLSFINNFCEKTGLSINTFLSLDKFVNDVLPNHTDVSISKKDASAKFKFCEEELTYVHVDFLFVLFK